jgi:DNA-binding NarL/FixJ family response regulator
MLYTTLQDAAELGAAPLAVRAREELQCLGLRPRRSAHTGAESLTPSEQRVARRAAAGLSNPAIAAELHLTRSTVETHLRSTYRKLGIAGRAELATTLGDRADSSSVA